MITDTTADNRFDIGNITTAFDSAEKPCPNCGYCPTCKRSPEPIYPWQPPWPWYPTYPWWQPFTYEIT